MGANKEKLTEKWRSLKKTSRFRDSVLFFVFILISALFWLIMALNDSAQNSYNLKVNIINVPDSVTFINDVPDRIHVSVHDKGSNLWRLSFIKHPQFQINFFDYASDGILRLTQSDLQSNLKSIFGPSAQITSISLDSVRVVYTTNKGKRVPVVVNSLILPSSGNILEGEPTTDPSSVMVYGEKSVLDTINFVNTQFIELKYLTETRKEKVGLQRISGARIIPNYVTLTVPIEPLVKKEASITVSTVNVPKDETLLLFPSKIPVSYFVAMSRLGDDDDNDIQLTVDYNDILNPTLRKVPVRISDYPERIKNLKLGMDSVEYAIVK